MEQIIMAHQLPNVEGLLKLNLQYFAEGGEGAGQGEGGQTGTEEGGEGQGQGEGSGQETKTFTQEDVNNLIAKETRKQQEKLLKDLGIDDFKNAKDGMKKFKEWQDSQKTEQEKLNEKLTTFETQLGEKENLISDLQAENEAIKSGITDEKNLKAVITLAKTMVNEEVDIKAAIKQVVEDYPHFAGEQQQQEEGKPSFSIGEHSKQPQAEKDKWIAAFKN